MSNQKHFSIWSLRFYDQTLNEKLKNYQKDKFQYRLITVSVLQIIGHIFLVC